MNTGGYNERAWAIDVIAFIKQFAERRRRAIRGAGGERTLDAGDRNLFPDVLLYGDPSGGVVLQGWELKMPDTPVTDTTLLSKAEEKARLLGLDSFVVANAVSAVLHVKDANDRFLPKQKWAVLAGSPSRQDVARRADEWKEAIAAVIDDLDDFFDRGEIHGRTLSESLSEAALVSLTLETAPSLAETLRARAGANAAFRAEVNSWWRTVRLQYSDHREPWLPLARLTLLLWVNRLAFAHLLTRWCTEASRVRGIRETTSSAEALTLIRDISDSCDFANILSGSLGADQVTGIPWRHVLQVNAFLSDLRLTALEQDLFRDVLTVLTTTARRRVAGQFVTPYPLASLLARLVLSDRRASVVDAFCGTGTIPRACYDVKRDAGIDQTTALQTIWASDKFDIQVQLATLALTQPDAIGVPVRVFRADVQELRQGRDIPFNDPNTGEEFTEKLPLFDAAVSNLPFVQFEDLADINPEIRDINDFIAEQAGEDFRLPPKSDLYAYLPFYLWKLVREDAVVGLILSNSWLGTDFGRNFREVLSRFFRIEHILVSGKGRWFKESDVVGSVVLLKKRANPGEPDQDETTGFVVLEDEIEDLNERARCEEVEGNIVLGRSSPAVSISTLSRRQIEASEEYGLEWSALFADATWLGRVTDVIVKASTLFTIARGERRGWNAMFYPGPGHGIEDRYLRPVLRSPSSVDTLIADPDGIAFCCGDPLEELRKRGDWGAVAWIERFAQETNNVGRPLPQVLGQRRGFWYEMDAAAVADIVGLINPGQRLFFPRMRERGFVDQRLVRFTTEQEADLDLLHALLNTVLSMYYLEAMGFGRGLGALDLSATKMKERLRMFDPRRIERDERNAIVGAFQPLLERHVLPIDEELQQADRQAFDRIVFAAFGAAGLEERVSASLVKLNQIRNAAV